MKNFLNILLENKRLTVLLIVLLLGIVFYSCYGHDNDGDIPDAQVENVIELEERLTNIISKIDGAGRVDVMITLHSEGEKHILKDSANQNNGLTFSNDASYGEKTVMQKDGSKEQPFVRKITKAEVRGVIVCIDGANNPNTKKDVISACTAVLDLPEARVSVVKRKKG